MAVTIIVSPFGVANDSLPAGTHFINDHVRINPLSDEHKARIVDYLDKIGEELLSSSVRKKPAFVISQTDIPVIKSISDNSAKIEFTLQMHRFSMEYFANANTPMASFCLEADGITSHSMDPNDLRKIGEGGAALPAQAWEKHSTYLAFLYQTIGTAPLSGLAMSRISRAFRQGPSPDGIVDLAVGLECLVAAASEIRFQFSLFHAALSADDVTSRLAIFELLQDFYDVRSKTVHGGAMGKSEKAKAAKISERWGDLIALARANLTYYVAYCSKNKPDDWRDHLRGLALGNPRTTD